MVKKYKRLWSAVRKLIIENHATILERSIRGVRGSRGMRGSYYIVGDLLAPLIGKDITIEDYNWYLTDQGYASYRDDIWPYLEQKHQLTRPEAKSLGLVYDHGSEYTISRLEEAWDQARGFIFVEKGDEAESIQELSDYGWTIVAGQGYPTRLMRKLLKDDARPVLALHDWDRDGMGVYRALGFETRRTSHLDLALGERVTDLGLTEEQVRVMNLPTRPSPPKYKGRPRVELSALEVLAVRMGLENPVLAYTVAAMIVTGIRLSPTPLLRQEMLGKHLRWALTDGLKDVVDRVVDELTEEIKLEGEAVTGTLDFDEPIEMPGLSDALKETGQNVASKIEWRSEDHYHQEALRLTKDQLVQLLKS